MFELKPIAKEAISRALTKAERYRLLNEPGEAESICQDILDADPGNQEAMTCMILALTDQFHDPSARPDEPRSLLQRLTSEHDRKYFGGMIEERWAKALAIRGYPRESVFPLVRKAMELYAEADTLASSGNDDAVLRWNACVRFISRAHLLPQEHDDREEAESFDDDVPAR
jgi:hypothetical protein